MNVDQAARRFSYVFSYDLDFNVRIYINSVEGLETSRSYAALLEDPYKRYQQLYQQTVADLAVTCQLFVDGQPLCQPVRTAHKAFVDKWRWDEHLELPVKYSALPLNAVLAINVVENVRPGATATVAGTTMPLFGKKGTLRKGRQRLQLWAGRCADAGPLGSTPAKAGEADRMYTLDKLMKKFERNEMARIDWLDKLTFREIEKINEAEGRTRGAMLYIDLPKFDFPVAFCEKLTELPPAPAMVAEVYDPDVRFDNLCEIKHRILTRHYRRGNVDRDLKPNADMRDLLNAILRYPPTKLLTSREKDLIWRFRYFLQRNRKALTFFLKCVNWKDGGEIRQASELLQNWDTPPVDDALELLSGEFTNEVVRTYAVGLLRRATDEELLLYLLQLVQALKYDEVESSATSQLADFLITRSIQNPVLATYFYWYVTVESRDDHPTKPGYGELYASIRDQLLEALQNSEEGSGMVATLQKQEDLVQRICDLSNELARGKDSRPKKIEKLQAALATPDGLHAFDARPLPLDPTVNVVGIAPEKCSIFKSALMPLRLDFKTDAGRDYVIIFKNGDDLRQDQLIIQMIQLMDQLLRREQLDLRLTPYKVLALGPDHGMVQFVDSLPVASVLEEHNSIQAYFRKHRPDPSAAYGIKPEVMDTYVRSCAGYCVITYILGIGDRHLDNLMLDQDGHLFHIDFGFILGRDPKPFAPPMKLSREMVEGMGGAASPDYKRFTGHCYSAFLALRRSANLTLNLFSLMADANIPDIAMEPDKAVLKVQDKYRLDLNEEEAVSYFQQLINDSVGALFPQMVEQLHKYLQYWRK